MSSFKLFNCRNEIFKRVVHYFCLYSTFLSLNSGHLYGCNQRLNNISEYFNVSRSLLMVKQDAVYDPCQIFCIIYTNKLKLKVNPEAPRRLHILLGLLCLSKTDHICISANKIITIIVLIQHRKCKQLTNCQFIL